jgi:hypothetical protein
MKKDKYEIEADKALKKLKKCKKRVQDSCMPCGDFFNCITRAEYVAKTYQSMNKDTTGGFEF